MNTSFYKIILFFFLISKPTVNALLLWNTQTQTDAVSNLVKFESWSITTLSSSTSIGCSPRPVLFKARFNRKKMQLQKPHGATSGPDQAPSHHKRRQLLLSHTEADCYHPTPWGVLCEYENHWTVCGQPSSSQVCAQRKQGNIFCIENASWAAKHIWEFIATKLLMYKPSQKERQLKPTLRSHLTLPNQ